MDYKFIVCIGALLFVIVMVYKEITRLNDEMISLKRTCNTDTKNMVNYMQNNMDDCIKKIKDMNTETLHQYRKINSLNNQPITRIANHFTETEDSAANPYLNNLSDKKGTRQVFYKQDGNKKGSNNDQWSDYYVSDRSEYDDKPTQDIVLNEGPKKQVLNGAIPMYNPSRVNNNMVNSPDSEYTSNYGQELDPEGGEGEGELALELNIANQASHNIGTTIFDILRQTPREFMPPMATYEVAREAINLNIDIEPRLEQEPNLEPELVIHVNGTGGDGNSNSHGGLEEEIGANPEKDRSDNKNIEETAFIDREYSYGSEYESDESEKDFSNSGLKEIGEYTIKALKDMSTGFNLPITFKDESNNNKRKTFKKAELYKNIKNHLEK